MIRVRRREPTGPIQQLLWFCACNAKNREDTLFRPLLTIATLTKTLYMNLSPDKSFRQLYPYNMLNRINYHLVLDFNSSN